MNTKQNISSIIGIENNDGWKVMDQIEDEGLYLAHYDIYSSESEDHLNVRGTIVSTNIDTVVSTSVGYTPSVIKEKFNVSERNVSFYDNDGFQHSLNLDTTKFTRGVDGAILRVYKCNGKEYRSTHKKINGEKAFLGPQRLTFSEMYDSLGGPSDLFGEGDFSPYCHKFIVCHKDLVVATRFPITKGFLVYLGYDQMWDPENPPFDTNKYSVDTKLGEVDTIENFDVDTPQPFIVRDRELTDINEINDFLSQGYWPVQHSYVHQFDNRLGSGEFVVCSYMDESGKKHNLRIHSSAYDWRHEMRNNTMDIWKSFVESVNKGAEDIIKHKDNSSYGRYFPFLENIRETDIKNQLNNDQYLITWPYGQDETETYARPTRRVRNNWLCYIIASPLHMQKEVSSYMSRFTRERTNLVSYIQSIKKKNNLGDTREHIRIKQILAAAFKSAKTQAMTTNRNGKYPHKRMLQIKDHNIESLIAKERGPSLFKLLEYCKNL